ncbi:MAG: hypothetical protein EBX88_01085, partial [Actinobacteria bacterium]|nr:hypothetical protein [Actinomycetota bacterium]
AIQLLSLRNEVIDQSLFDTRFGTLQGKIAGVTMALHLMETVSLGQISSSRKKELLESAATRVNVGGIIGYATCSPHIAETKMQVNDFLKRHPNFNRLKIGPRGDNDGDLQLWTFRDGTDCMYLSLLERQS